MIMLLLQSQAVGMEQEQNGLPTYAVRFIHSYRQYITRTSMFQCAVIRAGSAVILAIVWHAQVNSQRANAWAAYSVTNFFILMISW